MKALKLIRIDCDGLENRYSNAVSERTLGLFIDGEGLTAYGKIDKFLQNMESVHIYVAHGAIWPQFKIEEIELK